MIEKGYVAVLDMLTEEVHIYKFYLREKEMENFIKSKGHNPNSCTYMVIDELKLTIH